MGSRSSLSSILQQAYSTLIPIAFLAEKLVQFDRETTVYEPTTGNGSLLLANLEIAIPSIVTFRLYKSLVLM